MPEPTLPTQQFVDIKEIKNGVIYLKKGGLRRILIVSGINFDLKSEAEQNLILNSFQNFLNTIDFPVQFFVHSRKVNVDEYLSKMKEREEKEESQLLKIQIQEYSRFIQSFVETNAIINKTFFAVVPYESVSSSPSAKGILGLFQKTSSSEKTTSEQENLEQLGLRVNEVTEGLEQIGLRTAPLESEEIVELFYNLYNPGLIEKKNLEIAKKQA